MGTNYYLHKGICPHCGRGPEPLHIGKSSGGWCFSLHVVPEAGLNSLEDWKALWLEGVIKNEYGDVVTPKGMLETITKRSWVRTPSCPSYRYQNESWYAENYAEPGPDGLARHKLGDRCIGHGEGTWDLMVGEFS